MPFTAAISGIPNGTGTSSSKIPVVPGCWGRCFMSVALSTVVLANSIRASDEDKLGTIHVHGYKLCRSLGWHSLFWAFSQLGVRWRIRERNRPKSIELPRGAISRMRWIRAEYSGDATLVAMMKTTKDHQPQGLK